MYNLEIEMVKKKITNRELAKAIGKDEKTARNKLSGRTQFTFNEALAIRDTFFPENELEYLFGFTKQAG